MRYRDIIGEKIFHFPTPKIPQEIDSLSDVLTDPRPTHMLYQKGDVLMYHGEIGRVISTNDVSLVLALPSGDQIVSRRDPDLEVAPFREWDTFDLN